jgi:hydroxymethylpyrimidine pyrophosphatase-like HAD family hydrolase
MGRPFISDLKLLNSTYEFTINCNTDKIENFLISSVNKPLIIVGSGGSFSAAKTFEYLHHRSGLGGIAKAITPFELINYADLIRTTNIVLLTASGNNPDIINSYKLISSYNPLSFLIICINEKSKIKNLSRDDSSILFEKSLPSGKDGFLAINSLIATIIFIAKSYSKIILDNKFFTMNESFEFPGKYENFENNIIKRESTIILHGGMTTPVAFDIESKFSETALGNIQLADYRNFAHGRHYWLSKKHCQTSIISLISPNEKKVAQKTLEIIPSTIPIQNITTDKNNVIGILELFSKIFYLVSSTGKLEGIDPGKPKVSEYGRKMYHINYSPLSTKEFRQLDLIENRAILKKFGSLNSELAKKYKKSFFEFYNNLTSQRFNNIIFDYDDTLYEKDGNIDVDNKIFSKIDEMLDAGIGIKFATGRGKSIRLELQKKIEKKHWDKIYIGYYNGGEIAALSDDKSPNTNKNVLGSLSCLSKELTSFFQNKEMELRPKQLTIMLNTVNDIKNMNVIIEICKKYPDLKVFQSGHSMDIIPVGSSKLNVLNTSAKNSIALCIGDSGQSSGNDYELLSHKYSLSVNKVSSALDTCWNFAPTALKNTSATLYYLENMVLSNGCFNFSQNMENFQIEH